MSSGVGHAVRRAVGQRERLLQQPRDVAAGDGRGGDHPRAQAQLAVHARALAVQLGRPDARRRAARVAVAAGEVPLVEHERGGAAGLHRQVGDPHVLGGDAVLGVADHERDVGALGRPLRAQRRVVLDRLADLGGAADARGVDEQHARGPRPRSACRSRRASCPRPRETITRSRPRNALTSEDLPTFGRPMTARRTMSSSSSASSSASGRARRRRSSRSPVPRPCAADTGSGSPRPRPWKSWTSTRSAGESILLAATTTGSSPPRRICAISWSPGRRPARASTTSSATWASAIASRAWSWIETASGSSSWRSTPPVSISVSRRPFHSVVSSLRSRVIPGPLVDDRLARLREPVDERGLADVRVADDRDLHRSSRASKASVTI